MKNLFNTTKYMASICVLLCHCSAVFAAVAGQVQFVNGSVQATTEAGKSHQLLKGDEVNEGDTLTTTVAASAQIKMQDGGLIALRPDTKLKIDNFKFNGQQDGSEKSFFTLLKGGFRAVTGFIGQLNKSNYRITTATATLGIRGTDHETVVVTAGSPLAATAPIGTYNKVNVGETSMTTAKGSISVLPNQMGYAGATDQLPKLQPLNLQLFTVTPAPQAKGGKKEEGVRDSAVVDYALQDDNFSLKNNLPPGEIFIRFPITVNYSISGQSTLPIPKVVIF